MLIPLEIDSLTRSSLRALIPGFAARLNDMTTEEVRKLALDRFEDGVPVSDYIRLCGIRSFIISLGQRLGVERTPYIPASSHDIWKFVDNKLKEGKELTQEEKILFFILHSEEHIAAVGKAILICSDHDDEKGLFLGTSFEDATKKILNILEN